MSVNSVNEKYEKNYMSEEGPGCAVRMDVVVSDVVGVVKNKCG